MGKLGQLLVARGWITVQQLNRALTTQQVVGGRLGTCLIEMDSITEDNLLKGLSEQHGVPTVSLDDLRGIPDEVIALLPDKLARRCRTIPFRVVGTRLDVAMLEPRNLALQDEIAFASGKRVMVHVAHELRIVEALERYYREEASSRFSMLAERLNRARYFWERDKQPEPPKAEDELSRLPPMARSAAQRPAPPVAPPAATRAQAPPAPAPRRPSIQTVSMTEEERSALGNLSRPVPAEPAAAPPAPSPVVSPPAGPARPAMPPSLPTLASIDEVDAAFTRTHDREEVARIALSFLARNYRRAALFQIGKDKVSAWMGQGELDLPIFQKFSVSLDQPSLFLNLRNGSSIHIGPLPPMPAHRELARAWGGELPKDAVALPVRINDRVVAVVYADGGLKAGKGGSGAGGLGGMDLPHLQRLAAATGAALERCILHRKRAEAKS
ncbi:MAG: hypothetical protein QOH06_792 [Acidobacteriota bacterium]|jgi:hypothetical protein|nr:hypothetical protein [Acidobacteriota bacterium]